MGHFSMTCGLSGLPITGSTPAILILMKGSSMLQYAKGSEYGETNLISNEGPRLIYVPFAYPIKGRYDDYGGIEVEEDDNTKVLEDYFGLPIQDLMNIVTSNRKSDGFDTALKKIKKPVVLPEDWKEGQDYYTYYQEKTGDFRPGGLEKSGNEENNLLIWDLDGEKRPATEEEYQAKEKELREHYSRYSSWKQQNPDPSDDYGNPQYEEKYKELLSLSGMWVHRGFYERLTQNPTGDYFDRLDLGVPQILEALGFKEGERTKDERYNRPFTKGKIEVLSDGNWLRVPEHQGGIYNLKDFKKYCEQRGESLDISELENKDRTEEIIDYIIPTVKTLSPKYEMVDELMKRKESGEDIDLDKEIRALLLDSMGEEDRMKDLIKHILLSHRYLAKNPLSEIYFQTIKGGKLRDDIVRFWRFDHYMYSTGRYYHITGTSPQDGDPEGVMKVLDAAKEALHEYMEDRGYFEEEEE